MTKIQAGRLLTLAYFLRTQVPPRRLDMDTYFRSRRKRLPDGVIDATKIPDSALCAIGWATVVFPEAFRLIRFGYGQCILEVFSRGRWRHGDFYCNETQQFFGLDAEQCCDLFGQSRKSPNWAAKHIELVVESFGWVYA